MRLTLEIFALFEPSAKIRDAADTGFGEIDIERRMRSWAVDFSDMQGLLATGQDMANFLSAELEKGRLSRPLYVTYVGTDSLATQPWFPAGETHVRSLGKWQANRRTFHRHTGGLSEESSFILRDNLTRESRARGSRFSI